MHSLGSARSHHAKSDVTFAPTAVAATLLLLRLWREARLVSLHDWIGRHVVNVKASRWDRGSFVSECTVCLRPMIKLPGLTWQLRTTAG